jgi:predicted ATPase
LMKQEAAGRQPRAPKGIPDEPVDPPRVFINYRRDDAAGDAGRLYDALTARFGRGSVFMDVDTIQPGADFAEVINQAVESCDVLVTVIGKSWLGLADANGGRRLDNPKDLVRLEIQSALKRKILLVPALVQGAQMPRADQLPDALASLAGRNAFEISYARWQYDVERLITSLERPVKSKAVTPAVLRSTLPLQLTSFVDREEDVVDVKKLLRSHRLVTLLGPSGVGKTRLALRVAAEMPGSISATVVELAALGDPSLLASTVGNALGLSGESRVIDAKAIADWIAGLHVLLVLDNCEHLIDAVAPMCEDLLAASPSLTILATSGESLKVQGEAIWRVEPLPARTAAVRLFNDRARLRRRLVGKEDDAAVIQICERLDGLPLAIELAAARTEVMSPREMVARLTDRFGLLRSATRSRETRHRTLRSAIDWSHELLSTRERQVFARLSVFAGGFDLEAAEAVCAGEGVDRGDVAETVWTLVDKSLVTVRRGHEGRTRHALLETLREYGLERLVAGGDDAAARRRHAGHYLSFAETAASRMHGADVVSWLRRMDEDTDNCRATFSGGRLDAHGRLRMAAALAEYWDKRGRYSEARKCLTEALSASNEPSILRATALRGLALMAWSQSDLGEAEARSHESLEICRRIGDTKGEASSLEQLAQISHQREDLAQAREFAAAALALARTLDDQNLLARCLFRLGVVDMFEGKAADAARNLETASALGELTGESEFVAASMVVLGYIAATRGDVRIAGARFSRALSGWRDHASPRDVALILDGFALTAAAAGQDERAVCLAAAARALRRRIGAPPGTRMQKLLRQRLGGARKSSQARSASARGARMSLESAVAYALDEEVAR